MGNEVSHGLALDLSSRQIQESLTANVASSPPLKVSCPCGLMESLLICSQEPTELSDVQEYHNLAKG